jgi:uncharacterized protein (TIGR02679 family)
LDRGRPLAGLVAAAAAALTGCEDTRQAWEALGVLTSSLASTVLALGVPAAGAAGSGGAAGAAAGAEPARVGASGPGLGKGRGGHPPPAGGGRQVAVPAGVAAAERRGAALTAAVAAATAAALAAARAAPMPLVLTLDQVRSGALAPLRPAGVVFVCENPSILESAAARLRSVAQAGRDGGGAVTACLVCVAGQPSVAALEAIAILAAAGAEVRYHGDFDWAGLRIATRLARAVPWRPWRFGAADYLAAVRAGGGAQAARLAGPAAASSWDPALAQAMRREAVAIEEEAVIDHLVGDVLAAW